MRILKNGKNVSGRKLREGLIVGPTGTYRVAFNSKKVAVGKELNEDIGADLGTALQQLLDSNRIALYTQTGTNEYEVTVDGYEDENDTLALQLDRDLNDFLDQESYTIAYVAEEEGFTTFSVTASTPTMYGLTETRKKKRVGAKKPYKMREEENPYQWDVGVEKRALRKQMPSYPDDELTIKAAAKIAKQHGVRRKDVLATLTPSGNISGSKTWDKEGNVITCK